MNRGSSAAQYEVRRHARWGLAPALIEAGNADAHTLFIAGSGHSGSTLLDMLMGGHPQVASLGEAYFIYFNANNDAPADICTCGQHVSDCPQWSSIERAAQEMLGTPGPVLRELIVADPRMDTLRSKDGSFRKLPPNEPYPFRSRLHELTMVVGSRRLRRLLALVSKEVDLHRHVAGNLTFLYDAARVATDRPVVVDSTKNPGYMKGVWLERNTPMTIATIVRDGRAVCASRMRREGTSMAVAVKAWIAEHIKRRSALITIPRSAHIKIRYEELCGDPQSVLGEICEALGLSFDERMLDFRQDRHNLGGNPMRHRRSEVSISRDDRWREELSEEDLRIFARWGGALNRSLGYR